MHVYSKLWQGNRCNRLILLLRCKLKSRWYYLRLQVLYRGCDLWCYIMSAYEYVCGLTVALGVGPHKCNIIERSSTGPLASPILECWNSLIRSVSANMQYNKNDFQVDTHFVGSFSNQVSQCEFRWRSQLRESQAILSFLFDLSSYPVSFSIVWFFF